MVFCLCQFPNVPRVIWETAHIKMVQELLCQCKNAMAKLLLSHLYSVSNLLAEMHPKGLRTCLYGQLYAKSLPPFKGPKAPMEISMPCWGDTMPLSVAAWMQPWTNAATLLPSLGRCCLVWSTGKADPGSLIFAHCTHVPRVGRTRWKVFVSVILLGVEMFISEGIAHTAELMFTVAWCHPVLFSGSISLWQWCNWDQTLA